MDKFNDPYEKDIMDIKELQDLMREMPTEFEEEDENKLWILIKLKEKISANLKLEKKKILKDCVFLMKFHSDYSKNDNTTNELLILIKENGGQVVQEIKKGITHAIDYGYDVDSEKKEIKSYIEKHRIEFVSPTNIFDMII